MRSRALRGGGRGGVAGDVAGGVADGGRDGGQRAALRSPAAIKQVLAQSSRPLLAPTPSYFEQGAGALRPLELFAAMRAFVPHASSQPTCVVAASVSL